ncbi:MAG: hypothetical protein FRX49_13742 [Trebouxia sp. A1-2]|nr:MAG: hypothetical protein FRX49_13742 [Trebouxia sp. A1-2]
MPTHGSLDKLNRTPSTLSTVTEHSPGLTFLTGSESASTHTTIGGSTSPGFRMLDGSSTAEKAQLGKAALPGLAADKVRLGASHWNPRSLNRSRGTTAFEGSMWGVGKLFKSAQERQIAVSIHKNGIGPNELSFPDFFKYGISYNPDPSAGNVYRTIIISGLGSTVTMSALLEKVRGGVVVSAKLLDTTTITGSHTALITFLHEEPAVLLRDYAIRHPLTFKGHRAKVELLSRPTWPMAIPLRKAIEHGHTRCLTIRNFPHNISSERLRRDLCVCSVMTTDRIESMHRDTGGVLELRFESIWTAGKGYGVLTSRMAYRQCKVAFLPDPCAQPLAFPDEQTGPAFGISRLNGSETEDSQTLLGKGFSSTAGGFKGYSSGLLVPTLDVAQGKSALDIAKEHHLGDDGAQERLVINHRLSNAVILPDADVAAASVLDPTLSIISPNGVKPAQSEGCSNGATSGRMDSLGHEVNVVAGA